MVRRSLEQLREIRAGAAAALFTQSWSVSGGDDATSITGGQYFYTIHLANASQIAAQPTWSYDHEASEGNRLAFPVGAGVSKTIIPRETPFKFSVQYWYYVWSPEQLGFEYLCPGWNLLAVS